MWEQSGAWPEFIEVMRRALDTGRQGNEAEHGLLSQLMDLPGLCCQAAGGQLDWADDITLAWLLFYSAADIMDSIQDQDDPGTGRVNFNPGVALSAATGIYFSASIALNNLYHQETTRFAAAEIIGDFYRSLTVMSSGQYDELVHLEAGLDQYWNLVGAKSGEFFGLACRSGARLGTLDRLTLQSFSDYGRHLGLLIQILDDLDDIRLLHDPLPAGYFRKIRRSLPVVYTLQVASPLQQGQLRAYLNSSHPDQGDIDGVINIVNECGAALYVRAEIEKQRQMAIEAAGKTNSPAHLLAELTAKVNNL